jgi:hypothetical protein
VRFGGHACALLHDSQAVTAGLQGRSAGGLTMGAVLNLRPDLFNAAVLGVPFVDCLTTMLDDSIPLTTIEVRAHATLLALGKRCQGPACIIAPCTPAVVATHPFQATVLGEYLSSMGICGSMGSL